jgi:hypothetical protein
MTDLPGARWVRVQDIGSASELAAGQRIALLTLAITELAAAESLLLIHGTAHGLEHYWRLGGRVRLDVDGFPVIWSGGLP